MLNWIRSSAVWVATLSIILQQVIPADLFAQSRNESVTLPDFSNVAIDQAVTKLEKLGLKPRVRLGKRAQLATQDLKVYEQMPPAKSSVSKGSEISLLIYAPGGFKAGNTEKQKELTGVHAVPASTIVNDQIDPRTGLLMHEVNDLTLSAGPVTLEVRRNLLVEKLNPGVLGTRWRLNWERKAYFGAELAVIDEGPGMVSYFAIEPQGTYRSFSGETLVLTANLATLTRGDGTQEYFNAAGQLIGMKYRNGNKVALQYDNGILKKITGPFKSWLQFESDDDGRLVRISASNGAKVEYQYQSEVVTKNHDHWLSYSYGLDGRVAEFSTPQSGNTKLTYDTRGRVTLRRWADKGQETFEYNDEKRIWKHTNADQLVTITNWRPDYRAAAIQAPSGLVTVLHYDDAGRVIKVAGASGKSCVIDYDALGRVQAVVDSVNGVKKFEYQGNTQQATAIIDNTGQRKNIQYDQQGNIEKTFIEGLENTSVRVAYNKNGLVSKVQDATGATVTLTYDDRGRLTKTTDGTGRKTELFYDEHDNPVREVTADNVTTRKYDSKGRITAETDPAGSTTQFGYDDRGLLSEIKGPRGGVTRFKYDARGRRIKTTDPLGRTAEVTYTKGGIISHTKTRAGEVTHYKYDSLGNPISATNSLGGGIAAVFNANGNVTRTASSTGPQHTYKYAATGNLLQVVDRNNVGLQFNYDKRGRNVTQVSPGGTITRHEYDKYDRLIMTVPSRGAIIHYQYGANGDLLSIRLDDQVTVRFEYDEMGRKTREMYASGRVVDFQYDNFNRIISWQDNLGQSLAINRDSNGWPISLKDATGAISKLTYDEAGNLTSLIDPAGKETTYAYNLANELMESKDPVGNRIKVDYTPTGRIAGVTHPSGGKTRYEYDALGNPIKIIGPHGKPVMNKYDDSSRLIQTADAKGQTTKYTYDTNGRLAKRILADGTIIQYGYNKLGLLTIVDDGKFPVHMEYDAHGNRTKIEYPAIKRKLVYEYDEYNRLKKFVNSEGNPLQYEYDQDDRLTAMITAEGSRFTFTYDSAGRKKTVRFPNGIRGIWNYDARGQIAGLAYLDANQKPIEGWKYNYDQTGNLVETTDIEKLSTAYKYDAAGQLTEESSSEGPVTRYSYSAGGNRATQEIAGEKIEYHYNKADELTVAGKDQFRYDANGNLIEKRDGNKVTRYIYDTQDQLVRVELPDGKRVEYGYSPTGERIWRRDAQGKIWYVTDGINNLAELTNDLSVAQRFVHAPGIDLPLMMHSKGSTYFFHADSLGNIRRLTDNNGSTAAAYRYGTMGTISSTTGKVKNPFTFAARELDTATGLFYFRSRYYNPVLGRFTSVDPVVGLSSVPITTNPYQFCRNNPNSFVDPWGTREATLAELANTPAAFLSPTSHSIPAFSGHDLSATNYEPIGGANGKLVNHKRYFDFQRFTQSHPTGKMPSNVRGSFDPQYGVFVYPAGWKDPIVRAGTLLHEAYHANTAHLVEQFARFKNGTPERILKNGRILRDNYDKWFQRPGNSFRTERISHWQEALFHVRDRGMSPYGLEIRDRLAGYAHYGGKRRDLMKILRQWDTTEYTALQRFGNKLTNTKDALLDMMATPLREYKKNYSTPPRVGSRSVVAQPGLLRRGLGTFGATAIIGLTVHSIYSAENPGREAVKTAAMMAGGSLLVGALGAYAGAPLAAMSMLGKGAAFIYSVAGGAAAGSLFDHVFPPGEASQKMAQLMAEEARRRQLAKTNLEVPAKDKKSGLDAEFIPQENYTNRARELLAQQKPKRNYRDLAENIMKRHGDANNVTFEEYLKKAGHIEQQLLARDRAQAVEAERQRQAEIANYNQRVAAERAAQAAQMFQSIQQQGNWNPWAGNTPYVDQPTQISPGVRTFGPDPTWNFNR